MYDLIIIGGGPAGITAGIYAARQKLNTLLISKSFGGQIARKAVGIENYPGFSEISGLDLVNKFEKQLRKQKIDIERDAVSSVKKISKGFLVQTTNKNNFKSKAVIIATGTDPRPLEVPGEKKFIGKGVSYCTTCDGPLFANKVVAVIGGGDAGFEAAIFLASWAKQVYLLECGAEIRAEELLQERVKSQSKIKVITSAKLKNIKGKDFVEALVYQDEAKQDILLKVDGVFVEIGSQPATAFVEDLVEFNKRDEIIVDLNTLETKTLGLFAAGDVTNVPFKQIVIAAGQGSQAALSVFKYLQNV